MKIKHGYLLNAYILKTDWSSNVGLVNFWFAVVNNESTFDKSLDNSVLFQENFRSDFIKSLFSFPFCGIKYQTEVGIP